VVTRIRLRATRLALALSLTALVLATVAAEAHADIVADLEGAWIVAQATMNGMARVDGKAERHLDIPRQRAGRANR
jgi:hypothetical protein